MRTIQLWLCLTPLVFFLLAAIGCSSSGAGGTTTGNPPREDDSTSGSVAASVGGALSGSSSAGTLALGKVTRESSASAQSTCPTYRSSTSNGCSATGGNLWLDYGSCTSSAAHATITGTQLFAMSAGTASCGTFPNPGANATLYRQYVTASGSTTTGELLLHNNSGATGGVDDHSLNLSNFDNQAIAALHNGGYGSAVTFNGSGARSSLTLGHRVFVDSGYDHSLTGSITVTETAGNSSRTLSGSVTVYHNGLQIIGTATLNNVVHSDTCCLPLSGSISTSFARGTASPTLLGALMVGHSESLTFTGCGTATYQHYDGTLESVSLNRCY